MKFIIVIKIILARLRFVAVFLAATLVVGYWDDIKNHVDRWTRPAVASDGMLRAIAGDVEYFCSMHPYIVRSEPGNCPICSMPLIKRKRGEIVQLPKDVLARVQLTPSRVAMAGIQTEAVEYRALSYDIRALGVLDYDETRMRHISARVAGRADELFLKYTGQSVKKGDAVYSLYSPEVYTAQREYLVARARVNAIRPTGPTDAASDAAALYNASIQKLVLWGVDPAQLDAMEHEYEQTGKIPTHFTVTSPIDGVVIRKDIDPGHYVVVGEDPYTVADTSVLWLQAKLYEEDIPLVKTGHAVAVTLDALPGRTFTGRVEFMGVELDPATRTLDARITVDNGEYHLKPGMFAQATIQVPVTEVESPTTVPAEGVAPAATENESWADVYSRALKPYLLAAESLSKDSEKDVSNHLHEALAGLAPLKEDAAFRERYAALELSVHATTGDDLETLRERFKAVSAAMIEIGKHAGVRPDAGDIQVFRCPMKKANWLQPNGDTHNPYYGAVMIDCGSAVEPLPRKSLAGPKPVAPTTRPAGKVKSVRREAVIDTGRNKVVYVESSPGLFDMKAVTVGPEAGDFYPVLSGVDAGDRVATRGAFLVDAENRLNPSHTR